MEKKRKLGEPAAGNGDGEVEAELTAEKRQRVIGPALPPTPAAENDNDGQRGSESDSDSDSDDEIGPGLPSACSAPRTEGKDDRLPPKEEEPTAKLPEQKSGGQRDSWMLQPPGSTDWTGRIDPTKLRNRQFQTGKSAKGAGGSGQVDSSWTETPQEKMRRLQDQVMGVAPPSDSGSREKAADKSKRDEIMRERVQKYNKETRYSPSGSSRKPSEGGKEEDDPSKRAFDREKDMSLSSRITSAQRREMVNRASDFGSRFSGGKFL